MTLQTVHGLVRKHLDSMRRRRLSEKVPWEAVRKPPIRRAPSKWADGNWYPWYLRPMEMRFPHTYAG
jgi:hypothetical protein